MNSMWLCADPDPSVNLVKKLKKKSNPAAVATTVAAVAVSTSSASSLANINFFGIYSEHPVVVAKRLNRPMTPFSVSHHYTHNGLQAALKQQTNTNGGECEVATIVGTMQNEKIEIRQSGFKEGHKFTVISIF